MFEQLLQLDQQFFLWINNDLHTPFWDMVVPHLRHKFTYIPLYIALLSYLIYKFKEKAFWVVFFTVICIVISDQMSSHLIKPWVERLRPCNDLGLQSQVKLLLAHCGRGFSFTSSHATNHTALAIFLVGTVFRNHHFSMKAFWIFWALTVGFAQIYVGVHYPLDVICGTLLGTLIGYSLSRLFLPFLQDRMYI